MLVSLGPVRGVRSDGGLARVAFGLFDTASGRARFPTNLWQGHFVLFGRVLQSPRETGLAPDIPKRPRYRHSGFTENGISPSAPDIFHGYQFFGF